MYLQQLRSVLSQGDVFAQICLVDSASPRSPLQTYDVIVLSHTCEIVKSSNSVVLVCVMKSLSQMDSGRRGNVQRNRAYNAMYLEATGTLPESFIDFRYTFRVDKESLEEAVRRDFKIASLNDKAQLALARFFYRFLVRKIS